MIDKEKLIKELKRKKVYGALETLYKFLAKEDYNQFQLLDVFDDYLEDALKVIDYYDEKNRGRHDRPLLRNIIDNGANKYISYIFAYVIYETGLVNIKLYKSLKDSFNRATREGKYDRNVVYMSIHTIKSILDSEDFEDASKEFSLDDVIPFLDKINKKHKEETAILLDKCKKLESDLENQKKLTLMYQMNEKACMNRISELSKTNVEKQKVKIERIVEYIEDENSIKYDDIIDYIAKHKDNESVLRAMMEAILPKDKHVKIFRDVKKRIKEIEGDEKSSMYVAGDYVQNKHVENEVNGVQSGGVGINVRKR